MSVYSILDYGHMIADPVRMPAYTEALRRAVRPGTVVLDAGTGTGIFALLACRFGARRVYAVEPGDAVATARAVVRANGYADRVVVLDAKIEDVVLPERVDVLVADMRGALPLCGRHLPALRDARERWLRPGGALLPQRDTLRAAPVDAGALHRRNSAVWSDPGLGFDMSEARQRVVNTLWTAGGAECGLLADPATWAVVDYRGVEDPHVSGRLGFRVEREGPLSGFLLWFDAELGPGVGFSNAPGGPDTVYGRLCLPLPEAVPMRAGDRVELDVRARLVQDDYVWTWRTRVRDAEGACRRRFHQSTFHGTPLCAERLRATALDHAPGLSREGLVDRAVLEAMERGLAVEHIARDVASRFPDRFARWQDALPRVGALACTYRGGGAPAAP